MTYFITTFRRGSNPKNLPLRPSLVIAVQALARAFVLVGFFPPSPLTDRLGDFTTRSAVVTRPYKQDI